MKGLRLGIIYCLLALSCVCNAQDSLEKKRAEYDSLFYKAFDLLDISPDSSLKFIQGFQKRVEESRDFYEIGYTHYLKAEAYRYLGQYAMATNFFKKSLDIFAEANDSTGKGHAYHGLALISNDMDRINDAIEFYKLGLMYDTTVLSDVMIVWQNISRNYSILEKYDQSEKYLNKIESNAHRLEDSSGYYLAAEAKADLFYYKKDFIEALQLVNKCFRYYKKQGFKGYLANLHYSRADLYCRLNDLVKALAELKKGKEINEQVTPDLIENYYYGVLEGIEIARGDYKAAHEALKNYYIYQDAKKNQGQNSLLQALQNELEFKQKLEDEKRRNAIEKLKIETKLNAEKQTRYYTYVIMSVAVISALVLLFLLFKFKKLNKELDKKNKEIESKNIELGNSNTLKEKLIGLVAHDTRSPLAYTTGALEIINEGGIDEDQAKHMLTSLEHKTKAALEETDGIIKWARAQLSGMETNPEIISAQELFNKIIPAIETEFQRKKIKIKQDVTKECKVYADKTLLKLTLRNLLTNAAKFSNKFDEITIRYEKNGNNCLIKVIDNGIGMNKEEVEKLFTLQSQSKKGTNNERGTGLGLLQSHEFVKKMNGDISVESKKYVGTVFTIKLPDQPIKK